MLGKKNCLPVNKMQKELQIRREHKKEFFVVSLDLKTRKIEKVGNYDFLKPEQYKDTKPLPKALDEFAYNFNCYHKRCTAKKSEEKTTDIHSLINVSLYDHQKSAVEFEPYNGRGIVALEMGLGKSRILIAVILHIQLKKPNLKCLIVMPKLLIANWLQELKNLAPQLIINIIKSAKTADFDTGAHITLMSDALLSSLQKKLKETTKFDLIGVDESHSLKNIKSQRSKAFYAISSNTCRLELLSGTPALQNQHAYGLLRLLHNIFKAFYHYKPHGTSKTDTTLYFAERWIIAERVQIGRNKQAFVFKQNTRNEELQALMSVFLIHMKKADHLDLPPLIEEKITIGTLNKIQKKEFEVKLQSIKELREKNSKVADAILMELTRETMRLKTPFVVDYIKHLLETQSKFCCFIHHKHLSEQIELMLQSQQVQYIKIDSKVTMDKRTEFLHQFEHNPDVRVGILSFGCCSMGLNIVHIQLCLFCERTFDAVLQIQAENRLHRIGQKSAVTLQFLDLKDSTDEIIEMSVRKKRNNEQMLLGESSKENIEIQDQMPEPNISQKRDCQEAHLQNNLDNKKPKLSK